MINAALFRQSMKSGLKLLLLFALILTVYVSVMVTMFDPEIGKALEAFAKALPEIMAMVGMDTAAATLTGFLSNYLYGFIMLGFPMVYGMLLSNRLMADTIAEATGAEELLLHSCQNVSKEEFERGESYLSLMEQNIKMLKIALN